MHTITLGFTITGALEDAKVFANGVPVQCFPIGNGKFTGGFHDALIEDGSTLEIQFHLFGLTGTDYKIDYKFLDNGNEEEDPNNPSPIEDTISSNLNEVEIVRFEA